MTQRSILTLVCGKAPESISAQHGGYVDWFRQAIGPGVELEPWNVQEAPHSRPPLHGFAGILVTGSPSSLTEPEPWMEIAVETIREAAESQVPVLAVCFGHQLLGCAFGAPTVAAPDSGEHGCHSIELTEAGKSDLLFRGCPETFLVPSSHSDQVDPQAVAFGNGLKVLARSANTAIQALAAGPHIRSVQFHPEFSEAIMTSYLLRDELAMAKACECKHATRVLQNWIEHFCH